MIQSNTSLLLESMKQSKPDNPTLTKVGKGLQVTETDRILYMDNTFRRGS